jgi:hypothetical protein
MPRISYLDARPTIRVKQRNRPCGDEYSIGQRNGLSKGDISAAIQMYGNTAPTVIRGPYGILEVFMVGLDGQLYSTGQNRQNSDRWGAYVNESSGWIEGRWLPFPGGVSFGVPPLVWPVGNNPSVAQNADGRLEVFMVDSNGYLYHMFQRPLGEPGWAGSWYGSWDTPWHTSGGGGHQWLGCDPVVAQNADGRLELFMVGRDLQDEQLYHMWQTGPTQLDAYGNIRDNWDDNYGVTFRLGSQLSPVPKWSRRRRPAVAQNADARLELFIVNANDNYLYHRWQTTPNSSSQWSDWSSLGGSIPPRKRPAVAQNDDGRLEGYIVGSDGQLWHIRQTSKSDSSQWSGSWAVL